jgi:hypothetical protein
VSARARVWGRVGCLAASRGRWAARAESHCAANSAPSIGCGVVRQTAAPCHSLHPPPPPTHTHARASAHLRGVRSS